MGYPRLGVGMMMNEAEMTGLNSFLIVAERVGDVQGFGHNFLLKSRFDLCANVQTIFQVIENFRALSRHF